MIHPDTGWFVLIGDQKYGPYDYKVMIHMMQTNQLMDYNYVWNDHLDSWTQVSQLEEFSKDRFEILLQKESEYLNSFIQRKTSRLEVKIPLLGHNSTRFFDGVLVSVSENGGMCLINSPLVQVGDRLKLHIKPNGENDRAFNVEAEVIRKNFSKQRLNSKSGLYYAIRFNDIQSIGLSQIKKWVEVA
jgi:hypothetical protein